MERAILAPTGSQRCAFEPTGLAARTLCEHIRPQASGVKLSRVNGDGMDDFVASEGLRPCSC